MLQTAIKLSVPKRCRARRTTKPAVKTAKARGVWLDRFHSISAQLLEHDPIIWAFPNGYWTIASVHLL